MLILNISLLVINSLFFVFFFGYSSKNYALPFIEKLWQQKWRQDQNNPRVYMLDEVKKIITIGMKQQHVLKILGEPDETRSDGPLILWEYYIGQDSYDFDFNKLLLIFDENKRITKVTTTRL